MADNPLKKVWAYRTSDGHKVYVPEHYLDIAEFGLRKTPLERAKEPAKGATTARATEPARTTTRKTKAEEATR